MIEQVLAEKVTSSERLGTQVAGVSRMGTEVVIDSEEMSAKLGTADRTDAF